MINKNIKKLKIFGVLTELKGCVNTNERWGIQWQSVKKPSQTFVNTDVLNMDLLMNKKQIIIKKKLIMDDI